MRRISRHAALLQELAEFRYRMRQFLLFSETAASQMDLPAAQHQLLLQVAGVPDGTAATISYLAERLGLRHHSVVELSKRCEEAGLVERQHDSADRRVVVVDVTAKGHQVLRALAEAHARELHDLAPVLIETLGRIGNLNRESDEKMRGKGR